MIRLLANNSNDAIMVSIDRFEHILALKNKVLEINASNNTSNNVSNETESMFQPSPYQNNIPNNTSNNCPEICVKTCDKNVLLRMLSFNEDLYFTQLQNDRLYNKHIAYLSDKVLVKLAVVCKELQFKDMLVMLMQEIDKRIKGKSQVEIIEFFKDNENKK